jgi:hypothetical protein
MDEASAAAAQAQLAVVHAALEPYEASRYLNFTEEATDMRVAYSAGAYERLQAAKAQYDPENRFRANHQIDA